MARRVRDLATHVEYKSSTNNIRERDIAVMVDNKPSTNSIRTRSLVVMMEYTGTPVAEVANTKGPSIQIMT